MAQVGVQSNNLPGVLTMLADYYQKLDSIWTRLKGLMVYPAIVLIASLALSVVLAFFCNALVELVGHEIMGGRSLPKGTFFGIWFPPILLLACSALVIGAMSIPKARQSLRWRLPAFREANLFQFASAMALLLKGGCTLKDAIALMIHLEKGSPLQMDLDQWQTRIADGTSKFTEMALFGNVVPPLFIWLVANAQEDLVLGFQRAAEVYHERAVHRIEMFLYAALPASILALGFMILGQIWSIFRVLIHIIQTLGGE